MGINLKISAQIVAPAPLCKCIEHRSGRHRILSYEDLFATHAVQQKCIKGRNVDRGLKKLSL